MHHNGSKTITAAFSVTQLNAKQVLEVKGTLWRHITTDHGPSTFTQFTTEVKQ